MTLKSLGVLSCGKISGLMYSILGIIVGLMFSVVSMFGAAVGLAESEPQGALVGLLFGVGAIIIMPIFYGVLGFVCGLLSALLYNLMAGLFGGIEMELE